MNYYEIYFSNEFSKTNISNDDLQKFYVRTSENHFKYLMNLMNAEKTKYKFFQKSFKTYCSGTMIMENHCKSDIKVYEKVIRSVFANGKNYTCVGYNKEKKPYHSFPSTDKIHYMNYTNRLTFRISNRIYLNFDAIKINKKTDEIIYKVFINFNNDSSNDLENSVEKINYLINILTK